MKMKLHILALGLLAIAAAGCSSDSPDNIGNEEPTPIEEKKDNPIISYAEPIELSAEGIQGVAKQNEFAFKVNKEITKNAGGENTLMSPISLTTCLSMLANGTTDEASKEIIELLIGDGVCLDKFNEVNGYLMSQLTEVDKSSSFVMSNSAWLNKGLTYNSKFESSVKQHYSAGTSIVDLFSSEGKDLINEWTKNSTNGLIPKLFDSAPCSKFVLANAIYFQGGWVIGFDKDNTAKKNFNNIDGSSSEVDMMKLNETTLEFHKDEDCSAVKLTYGNTAFSFYAILPSENMDFHTFVNEFTADKLNAIERMMRHQDVTVELPKFQVSYDIKDFSGILNKCGLSNIFGETISIPNIAQESISGNVDCLQKSSFMVNESGAEGASVTSLGINYLDEGSVVIPAKQSIILDRPFLFIVQEKSTKAILFIGTVIKL